MVMGHHVVTLDKETKTPRMYFIRSLLLAKMLHLSAMAATQEVMFYIKLAYKYKDLSMESNA